MKAKSDFVFRFNILIICPSVVDIGDEDDDDSSTGNSQLLQSHDTVEFELLVLVRLPSCVARE